MIEDYYKSGWTYKAVTNGQSTTGAPTITYGVAIPFSAFVCQLGASEQKRYSKLAVLSTHTIFTSPSCAIKENYAVFDPDGREYKVLNIDNVHRMSHHLEIAAELVR